MTGTLLVRGGTVWDDEGGRRADLLVHDGSIVDVGPALPEGEEVIDATGLDVVPGMTDLHVHASDRIGTYTLSDTLASAGEAALACGVTSIASFATQRPGESLAAAVGRMKADAARCRCHVHLHLTPTVWPWDWEEVASLVADGYRTFKLYTTYREAGLFTPYERFREVMGRLADLGATLLVHCEDDEVLGRAAAMVPSPASAAEVARRRPPEAETTAVAMIAALAASTGCPTHVVHVSTPESAELVAAAATRTGITCEASPHHLLLDSNTLDSPGAHRLLCTPPLRGPDLRARLEARLQAGDIDVLATDHCPFSGADKDRYATDPARVPNGLAGLGALVPLAHDLLVRRGGGDLSALVRLLASGPSRVLGAGSGSLRPGAAADIVVLDGHAPARSLRSSFSDCHDPWAARHTTLAVRHVLLGGRPVALKAPPAGS